MNECIINGKRQHYDACSVSSLKNAKKFYKHAFDYIGSGTGELYINGTRNFFSGTHHFFIKKTLKSYRKSKLEKINLIANKDE